MRQVERDSPAERAGTRPGDVILECHGQPVKTPDDLVSIVTATVPGTPVPVVLSRMGERQTVSVTLEIDNRAVHDAGQATEALRRVADAE